VDHFQPTRGEEEEVGVMREDDDSELGAGEMRCSEMASIHSLFAPAVGAHTTIVAGRPLYSLSICHRTHTQQ